MFIIKRHDTRPRYIVPLVDNYKEVNEEPLDLTTVDKVFFVMRERDNEEAEPTVRSEAEVLGDPKEGIVQYTWQTGDTDTLGNYESEFELQWEDGGVETVPNADYFEIEVVADLG